MYGAAHKTLDLLFPNRKPDRLTRNMPVTGSKLWNLRACFVWIWGQLHLKAQKARFRDVFAFIF